MRKKEARDRRGVGGGGGVFWDLSEAVIPGKGKRKTLSIQADETDMTERVQRMSSPQDGQLMTFRLLFFFFFSPPLISLLAAALFVCLLEAFRGKFYVVNQLGDIKSASQTWLVFFFCFSA